MSRDILCPCCNRKRVAKERDGKIYVWCKECKKEIELKSENGGTSHEPSDNS